MIIILFTPLQGGGHRFKSYTAHQGNQGVTDSSVTPFSFVHLNLYTLRRESRTALGRSNKFAALLAAICALIGSRKAKSKAGEIPPFFVSPVVVWGMGESAYAAA